MDDHKFTRSRGAKLTHRQRDFLAQFMGAHPDLACGKCSGPNGRAASTRMWQRFAEEANKLGPPKDAAHWQKAWTDTKCRVRSKVASLHAAGAKVGSPGAAPFLHPSEETIWRLMTKGGTQASDPVAEDRESVVKVMNTYEDGLQGVDGSASCNSGGASDGELNHTLNAVPFWELSTPADDDSTDVNAGASTSSGTTRVGSARVGNRCKANHQPGAKAKGSGVSKEAVRVPGDAERAH